MKQSEEAHFKKYKYNVMKKIRKPSIPIDKTDNRTNKEIIKF